VIEPRCYLTYKRSLRHFISRPPKALMVYELFKNHQGVGMLFSSVGRFLQNCLAHIRIESGPCESRVCLGCNTCLRI
jgi:hypothetical protein